MSTEDDFTEDVIGTNNGNEDFAKSSEQVENNEDPVVDKIPKGTDDNSAEDRKLFIGGLSWETREPQLKSYFEKFGEVESVNLKLHPVTGRSRCFAFVVFKEPSSLNQVFEAGDHAINSKKVDVKRAKAKPGKMFLGGLKPELTDEQIREHFSQFGTIIEFEMPFDKIKNQRKGFGFITFEKEETMKELIKKGKEKIGEAEIDLKKATPRSNEQYYNNASVMANYDSYGYDYYGGDYSYGSWGDPGYRWGPFSANRGGGKVRGRGHSQPRGGQPY